MLELRDKEARRAESDNRKKLAMRRHMIAAAKRAGAGEADAQVLVESHLDRPEQFEARIMELTRMTAMKAGNVCVNCQQNVDKDMLEQY